MILDSVSGRVRVTLSRMIFDSVSDRVRVTLSRMIFDSVSDQKITKSNKSKDMLTKETKLTSTRMAILIS